MTSLFWLLRITPGCPSFRPILGFFISGLPDGSSKDSHSDCVAQTTSWNIFTVRDSIKLTRDGACFALTFAIRRASCRSRWEMSLRRRLPNFSCRDMPNCTINSSFWQNFDSLSTRVLSNTSARNFLDTLIWFSPTAPCSKARARALICFRFLSTPPPLRNWHRREWTYRSFERNIPRQFVHGRCFLGLTVLLIFLEQIRLPSPLSSTFALWLKFRLLRSRANSNFYSAWSWRLIIFATSRSSLCTETKCLCIFIFNSFPQKKQASTLSYFLFTADLATGLTDLVTAASTSAADSATRLLPLPLQCMLLASRLF